MRDSQGRDSFTKDALLSASDQLLLAQLFTSSEEASKTKRLCETTAACFALRMMPGRRFVLDGTTRAVIVTKSFPSG